MRWSNEMFYILLFNSFAGAIAYGFWMIAKSGMAKKKKLKYVYPMLGIVEAFFIFPVMFVYLKVSTHVPGSHGSYYGTLFLQTPFIYMAECLMAGIWILGMIFYLGNYIKEYWKFKSILKKSFAYELPADVCSEILQELKMKRKITLYQNYAVTSPIVVGWWNKKIIFPVQDYEERELVTILYHELVHIRQHILEMKKIGIFLKLIFWCNPMMNSLLQNIDEWGEIACDRYVCYETAYPYTVKEYYTVAVDGLEQSHIWMPQMVTGFKKKSNFKRRLLQMKNYRKEKEMKFVGGIALSLMLCVMSTTTTFAAAEGFKAGYEKVFDDTTVEIEEKVVEDVEYEEDFFPENENIKFYNQNGINLIGGSGAIDSTSLEKGTMLSIGTVYAEKNQGIGIRLNITPSDKSVQYGIITSDNKKRFVYGTGSCYHVFSISDSGNYEIFIKNTSSKTVTIEGGYSVY